MDGNNAIFFYKNVNYVYHQNKTFFKKYDFDMYMRI